MYHFNRDIFKAIDDISLSIRGEYELTDAINLYCQKTQMRALHFMGCRDISYPWDILQVNNMAMSIRFNNRDVPLSETFKPTIGEGTLIRQGSHIEPNVVIGNNCEIGPNCYIRADTSIGDNCRIGNGCEIKNSVIMSGTKIPHLSYVGDSVIGENCNLGAGTIIANRRLDGKEISVVINGEKINTGRRKLGAMIGAGTQIGINVSINPGTIIPPNSKIYPICIKSQLN
jgi:bifunctional UDP-N-acetylglucosamine pyrophosphorylase/glucosamine-1-phosphate N-acetyltransferase